MTVQVNGFYHDATGTVSYIVSDSERKHAVIIDSVLDFDLFSGEVSSTFADKQLAFLQENQLTLDWILDTHAHADHLSAAHYLHSKTGVKTCIGEGIKAVEARFAKTFNYAQEEGHRFDAFDKLLQDGELLQFGSATLVSMSTPGHTSDSLSYIIDDNVFVGDTLFMPDGGTARCDFPGGDAGLLWDSISRLHQLPAHYKIWVCHDYQPDGRQLQYQTTVAQSQAANIHVNNQVGKAQYVALRNKRDATLAVPKLLYPSLQVNLQAGKLPQKQSNGLRYMSIPLTDKTQ